MEIQDSGVGDFKVQELEIQGSGVGDSRFRSWRFKIQELEVQGSGVGGASLWKAAAQAATRSGLGGDSYFLFLFGWQF